MATAETEMEKFDPVAEGMSSFPGPPAQPGEAPVPAKTTDNEGSVLSTITDMGKGILSGAEGAVRGVHETLKATGLGEGTLGHKNTTEVPEVAPKPQGIAGQMAAAVTQAAFGYTLGGGVVKGAGVLAQMGKSAVGIPLVADPNQQRLSNILMQYPFLAPIVAPLAQDPTDSVLMSKVKAGLEDVLLTGAAGVVFKGVHLLYLKASGKAKPEVIAKAEAELASTPPPAASVRPEASMNGSNPTVTLYRGQFGEFPPSTDKADAGRWFSSDKDAAAFFGDVRQVDVPGDVAAAARVTEDTPYNKTGHLLPAEWANKAKPQDSVKNFQAAKDATKAMLLKDYTEGATSFAFRGTKVDELKAIAKTGKLQVGADAEGNPGISASNITKDGFPAYGDGTGIISKAGQHTDSGRFGEVLINEASHPKDFQYVVGGKVLSFDEMKASFDGPPKAAKPVTLTTPDLDSAVTLTPLAATKFTNLMEKMVIKDAVDGITTPTAGVHESAAKVGAPLRPKYNDSPNNVLESLVQLGKLTKTELAKSSPAYRSVDETKRLASIMGQDHDALIANLKAANAGLEDIDAIATGARQYLQLKGAEMWQAARKATISGDPESKAAFAEQFTHLSAFQAELSEVTTRLGRGLRSFGESVGPFDPKKMAANMADPKLADDLSRIIAATDGDVDKIAHVLKMQQLSWFQKAVGTHNEYWTGLGLLSRVATQTVNMSSTAINNLMEPAAMVVGGVERGLTGKGWAEAREGVAIYNGMRTAFFDSMHMAWQAAKTEHAIISQSGTMEQPTKFISALTYNMNPESMPGKFIDIMGNITRLSFRGLTAGDEFFKQLSYRAKVSATASREAVDMVKAGTLEKKDIQAYVEKQLQASINEQGAANNADALKYAEKASFVNDLKGSTWGDYTSMGEMMARVASGNPMIRGVILPFVKTPTNVTRTTFEYTPLIGQLRKQFYTDVAAGGEKQALALGKLTMGAGMYVGAAMLALEGRITGAPPAPGVIVPAGHKPYSIVFKGMGEDGGDLFLSYQRMQPFGDILGLTADFAKSTGMLDVDTRDGLAQSMSLAIGKLMSADSDTAQNAGIAAGAAYGKSLISKTYYRNMTEFFSTFSGYNNEKALVRWFQNYTASHVPGVLSQFNSDDTVREIRSTLDATMARIPGLSQQLPAKRDYFGNIHDVKVGFPWSIVQPLAVSETKHDPVMNELHRLSTSNAETKFSEPPSIMSIAGKKVDLKTVKNDDGVTAYDRMTELMHTVKPAGKTRNFHDELEHVMKGERYRLGQESDTLDGSPLFIGYRTQAVKKEEGEYRKAALDAVKNEFKAQLGIESALKDSINTAIGKKKVGAGVYDKILELTK